MKCRECLEQISDYLDGGIDAELRHTLEAHLRGCRHCRIVFDSTRKTIELYCDGRLFELPVGVRERLHAALRQRWEERVK